MLFWLYTLSLTVLCSAVYAVLPDFRQILSNDEFPEEVAALDDVAPHLGNSVDKKYPHGSVHVSMLQNPSHLEAVDPVVMGKVRAKQLRGACSC